MAKLTLEILYRNQSQFHKIDRPLLRIGRALDNDIILPDPAVSAYHLALRTAEGGAHELVPLADENGTHVAGRAIDRPITLDKLPLTVDIGRTRIVVHDRQQPVAATRLISCRNGGLCIFGHWIPAILLFAAMTLFSAYDNYLATPKRLAWESFGSDQAVIMAIALVLTLAMLLINRITSHRWEFASSLSFVSFALILGFGIDQLTAFLDYYFTSPLPGFTINTAWAALFVPLFTLWFLARLHHGNMAISLILVVIIFTPGAYLQTKQVVNHYGLLGEFTKTAHYSRALYPWDIRAAETLDIESFSSALRQQQNKD